MKIISRILIVGTLTLLVACNKGIITEADYNTVPLPNEINIKEGKAFILNKKTQIFYSDAKLENLAKFLSQYIEASTGILLETTSKETANSIKLVSFTKSTNKEAYQLKVTSNEIEINGASEAGIFYGIQTLRKSLPVEKLSEVAFPQVTISDYPRFEHRGVMLDVARHFSSIDFVKKYIDILVLHNINVFHWHLTDDQGWRIEIKKYPKLAEMGSIRKETVIGKKNSGIYDGKEHGGFYTQDQIKEIIDYAKERYVTVIPEIDMPGHMLAALKAYPELGCTGGPYEVGTTWGVFDDVLCAGNPQTLEFVKDILTEVIELFPSKLVHIGGDECPKVRWEKCPKCQALIKSVKFVADKEHSAEQRLQSYFISEVEKFVNEKGRNIIGWDEILEGGIAPNATIMSWRGTKGGIAAAQQGHNVIMTPSSYMYFDYHQATDKESEPLVGRLVTAEKAYSFEPVAKELTPEQAKHIIGVQANMWVEFMPTAQRVEFMMLPRVAALSEVQWMQPNKKNYADFENRMTKLFAIYDNLGLNYAKYIQKAAADSTKVTDSTALVK